MSLIEILISIAVISIGMMGTLAAIAFGLRASDRGSKGTFALNINRRIIELILNRDYPATTSGTSVAACVLNTSAFPLGFNDALGNPQTDAAGAAPWHSLSTPTNSTAWFPLTDFVANTTYTNPAEWTKFQAEATQYENNVHLAVDTAATGAARNLVFIQVQTRWRDKGAWRWIYTEAATICGAP